MACRACLWLFPGNFSRPNLFQVGREHHRASPNGVSRCAGSGVPGVSVRCEARACGPTTSVRGPSMSNPPSPNPCGPVRPSVPTTTTRTSEPKSEPAAAPLPVNRAFGMDVLYGRHQTRTGVQAGATEFSTGWMLICRLANLNRGKSVRLRVCLSWDGAPARGDTLGGTVPARSQRQAFAAF